MTAILSRALLRLPLDDVIVRKDLVRGYGVEATSCPCIPGFINVTDGRQYLAPISAVKGRKADSTLRTRLGAEAWL